MTDPLTIRDATRADYEQWLPLSDGYNAFYECVGPTALPADVTATTWARFFDANEPMHCLIAARGGLLPGLAHYLFHRSTSIIEPTCYLNDLFANEAARGQGIGRALTEAVYGCAKAAGATRVYLHTHETSASARRLYDQVAEHSGFVMYRRNV